VQHAAKRRQIADAAAGVFAERGFDGATTAEICRAAGVSTGNLFHYFSSKREIFVAVLTGGEDETAARLAAVDADRQSMDQLLPLQPVESQRDGTARCSRTTQANIVHATSTHLASKDLQVQWRNLRVTALLCNYDFWPNCVFTCLAVWHPDYPASCHIPSKSVPGRKSINKTRVGYCAERRVSNPRPLPPQSSALPGCATLRRAGI
jgi:AcrR family transcriptional regulator